MYFKDLKKNVLFEKGEINKIKFNLIKFCFSENVSNIDDLFIENNLIKFIRFNGWNWVFDLEFYFYDERMVIFSKCSISNSGNIFSNGLFMKIVNIDSISFNKLVEFCNFESLKDAAKFISDIYKEIEEKIILLRREKGTNREKTLIVTDEILDKIRIKFDKMFSDGEIDNNFIKKFDSLIRKEWNIVENTSKKNWFPRIYLIKGRKIENIFEEKDFI